MAYSGSKDFSEHYVTQGAGAADLNGGGPNLGAIGGADGPVATYANCDVAAGIALHWDIDNNNGGGGWGATQVGDFVRIDTAGVAELGRVTTINLGADPDVIEVVSAMAGAITAPVNAKNCNVGGALATAQAMADLIVIQSYNPAIGPPRIDIKRHAGNAYDEAFDIDTNAGNSAIPITYEGYNTVAGDIDPLTSTDRTKFLATVAATHVIAVDVPFTRLLNLDCETAVALRDGIRARGGADYLVVINCRGKGTRSGIYVEPACGPTVIYRCLFEESGDATWPQGRFVGAQTRVLNCVFRNGAAGSAGVEFMGLYSSFCGNHVYGNPGDGMTAAANALHVAHINANIIADNGGDGIDLGTEADLETNVITNNIIAHNVGWGIAGTSNPGRFAVIDYNVIWANTAGAVQDLEAGGGLLDDSNHDDEANAPFTGANAGARVANFYELTTEARQIQQLFADDDFKTYPDAGAAQAMAGGSAGRGFCRGMA